MTLDSYYQHISDVFNNVQKQLEEIMAYDEEVLNKKPGPKKWSAIECIDHLNQAYSIYMPNFKKAFVKNNTKPSSSFKPGLLGNRIINSVGLKENGKANMPMSTFKSMEPGAISNLNAKEVFQRFEAVYDEMKSIIEESKKININKTKINSALGPIFKLRLGVAFLFLMNHDLRHLAQARNAIANS